MFSIFYELNQTLRRLAKTPGFSATAVLMLAFGIGVTTAIFSIVNGVLLRPLPFPQSDRLVTLGDQLSGTNWGKHDPGPVTGPEVLIYPRETRSFASLGGYAWDGFEVSGIGEPVQVVSTRMTSSVFTALGMAPLMGRVFTDQEDEQKQQVVVLSYATWKERFHGDANVVGTKVLLDRKPYLVIGVMPRDFEFPLYPGRQNRSEMWVPMSFAADEIASSADSYWHFGLVGRLKPGVTVAQAQDDAERVAQQVMQGYPADSRNFHIRAVVYPLQAITVMDARPMLRMLFLAVAVVLLIACANFAGLLLVRAIQRQRETAVRLAIGAPAMTLARQMILESLALSGCGGLLGIGLAAAAIAVGRNFLPETMPLVNKIALDWRVAGFALLLAALTGFFCGLAPGFAALRTNVNAAMKDGGRSGSTGGSHARLRSALVVLEIAVALVLLTASGLLLRSYRLMSAVNLGFRPDHVATAVWGLPLEQYGTQAKVDAFNRTLLEQLRQQPGAEAVGLTTVLPMAGGPQEAFVPEGFVDPRGPDRTVACPYQVDGDALEALGMPLLRGRYFTESDNADGQLVVMVNHELAEHYWPHQDPIGKRLRVGTQQSGTPWQTVVGEVADAKQDTPDADAREQFYEPVAQLRTDAGPTALPTDLYGNAIFLVMRSKLPAKQMESGIRSVVRGIDPQLALTLLRTMDEVVAQSEAPRRFNTIVISSFALAAVLLAVLGIYSVVAFSVASRVQEMAIRMALGSQRSDILRLIFVSGLKLALVGSVLGLGGAVAASRVMRAFLFGVSPFDPLVMILAAVVVFALALAASALPARRAASVDPLQALRGE